MTDQELQQLVENVKAVTDRLTAVDAVLKSERLGEPKVVAFRCSHSGLYFPANYAKGWGTLYGFGMGSQVCSETLDTDYEVDPPNPNNQSIQRLDQIMHPVRTSLAQVDFAVVAKSEFDQAALIPAYMDPMMTDRAAIIRQKQRINPRSRIQIYTIAAQKGRVLV